MVDELPAEEEPETIDYVEVMGPYDLADIALIKSILDAEKIIYYFKGEYFPFFEPVGLMVKRDEVDKAKEILQDL